MKRSIVFILTAIASLGIAAQENPKLIGIEMIGKSEKPIISLFIIDSTREKEFTPNPRKYKLVYAESNTLEKIYLSFVEAKEYDSLKKYDYSFGTFGFTFRFGNKKKYIVGTRTQSAIYLQKIICMLSPDKITEMEIMKEVNEILKRINY